MLSLATTLAVSLAAPQVAAPTSFALRASKVLTCADEGDPFVNNGIVLVKDGKIEAVGRERDIEIPEGYELFDCGDAWLAPGFVELHCHEAGRSLYSGVNDLNDTVYLTNPGMRASAAVDPGNRSMQMAVAAGVTTVLYIPGSGSNIGGQGILLKTSFNRFEENLVKNPGSMKLAQWGNPESWGPGVGRTFENWNTRHTLQRGIAYAKTWEAFEAGEGEEPQRNVSYDVFRHLRANDIAISTHTQFYQVVLMTLTMVHGELGLPVFLDHSSLGGWRTGALAEEMGVAAICGPRSVDPPSRRVVNWAQLGQEGFKGLAAGYQEQGHTNIGFNTDSPVIPQEELPLNAAMGARYGFDDSNLEVLRGLTIVPAKAARIADRVGSLEAGKDADILVVTGHPADPRTAVEAVFVNGRRAYDAERDGRRW